MPHLPHRSASPVRPHRALRRLLAAAAIGCSPLLAGPTLAATVPVGPLSGHSAISPAMPTALPGSLSELVVANGAADATEAMLARRFGRTSQLRRGRSNSQPAPSQTEPEVNASTQTAPTQTIQTAPASRSLAEMRKANKPPMVPAAEPESLSQAPKRLAPVIRQASTRPTQPSRGDQAMPFAIDLPSPAAAPERTASSSTRRTQTSRTATQQQSTQRRPNQSATPASQPGRQKLTPAELIARQGAPIPPPVKPPVPMSLRPGYGRTRTAAATRPSAPPKTPSIAAVPANGDISGFLPPPAPPVDASAPPTVQPVQRPQPARVAAAPAPVDVTGRTASSQGAYVPPPVGGPVTPPPVAVAQAPRPLTPAPVTPNRVTPAPVDLTPAPKPRFVLQPQPNLPIAMPSRAELFPADGDFVTDPELPPQVVFQPQPLATRPNAAETFVAAAPQPIAASTGPVERDDNVATVSIDTLTPKPAPLAVVPDATPIVPPVQTAPAPAFELPEFTIAASPTGLDGFCPVALCEERDLVDADLAFEAVYQGRLYHFSSAEALAKFRLTPSRYAPAARGRDVVMLATGEGIVDGKLDHAVWYRGRLYLFQQAATMRTFSQSPKTFAASR